MELNMEKMSYDDDNKKEEKLSITKSVKKNGITKRIEVDEVENGFIICISKHGKSPDSKEYIDEYKKYISETNPLAKEVKEENKEKDSSNLIDVINNLNL